MEVRTLPGEYEGARERSIEGGMPGRRREFCRHNGCQSLCGGKGSDQQATAHTASGPGDTSVLLVPSSKETRMASRRTIEVVPTAEQEEFVVRHLRHYRPLCRFDLMAAPGSPLEPKTAFYVLRNMEERGLIKSSLPTGQSPRRLYRLP